VIYDIENTDGVVEFEEGGERVKVVPGDGYEYTLAWVRTGSDAPVVTATVDWPDDNLVTFEFIAAGETIEIVENVALRVVSWDANIVEKYSGSSWLCLDNTEEYEPETLLRLTELYGHESEVLEAMRDALEAVEVECEYCKGQHCPFDENNLHNCSEHWVPAEWEREADGMNSNVSILRAIVDVTGVAFGCTNTGKQTAADEEWRDGYRSEEVIKRAWELVDEDEDTLCWGLETYTRGG